ncbi:PREDICTED: LOW QUALITY PROTEIN: putative cysteine-rich repeat secretory protein 35 [Camelina sativa]|uniref:LOW QUALITY PROTEIN: putative cysteine-rich repeat secretory protein 35 n=1 Tax=Camelina sativa TaxID=90675 RepID=A0ABM1RCP8_CAMSA|nr:PREDICTED: LOW QUALITY PROTEIN: putative cysteine-rich repeat secretory protein 35 [Camelina sativa]
MYSSYSLSKHLVYVSILAILLLVRSISSLNLTNQYLNHKCFVSEGKYKHGGKYEKNLNVLSRYVSDNDLASGYVHVSHGEAPDSVTIILQCRGDSFRSNCHSCYATAVDEFHRRCQGDRAGIIWYDQCFLVISKIKPQLPRKIDFKNTFSIHNPKNVSKEARSFDKMTREFLYELVRKASYPTVVEKLYQSTYYAAGEKKLGANKIYAMMQCASDILQCKVCLEWCIRELPKCCNGKQGGRVLGISCNLRYELYPFLRS